MTDIFSSLIKTNVRVFVIISLFVLAAYSPMLASPFKTLDDDFSIVNNPAISRLSSIPSFFTTTYFRSDKDYYRPLVNVSYALEYHFFKLNYIWYNFDNALLHVLNAFLVFLVAGLLLNHRAKAFAVAFLFALHPVHWEAVCNISGRAILLCAFFVLAGWVFFLHFVRDNKIGWLLLAALSYGLGLLCKESAGVFIFAALVFWWVVARRGFWSALSLWPLAGVAVGYVLLRKALNFMTVYPWHSLSDTALGVASFLGGVLTYIKLFFWPVGLYFDRAQTMFYPGDPRLWLTLGVYAVLLIIVLRHLRRMSHLTLFCIVWFWIELLPVSQIITTIGVYPGAISLAEHFVYKASIPVFLLMIQAFWLWMKNRSMRKRLSAVSVGIIAVGVTGFLLVQVYQQATYASSEFVMTRESLRHDPRNTRVQYSLGALYVATGQKDLAVEAFRKVLELDPGNVSYRLAYGISLAEAGQYLEAARVYEFMPEPFEASVFAKGKIQESYRALAHAYEQKRVANPKDIDVAFALGVFYYRLAEYKKAQKYFQWVLSVDRTRFDALFNMAGTAEALKELPKAVEAYKKLVNIAQPDNQYRMIAVERLKVLMPSL